MDVKRKTNTDLGKTYNGRDEKLRKNKEIGSKCSEKCKLKCLRKITKFERDLLFVFKWSMRDILDHWDLINKYLL